ncbi:MAG: uL15m family ribosomal protein [Candidatus Pacearchaeota archaeon]
MKKKRKKSSRMRGSHTHGRGGKKKARGSGHRGGFGLAGTGKRADHKKTLVLNIDKNYFGKESLKPKKHRYKEINLRDLEIFSKGKKDLDLRGYKILGDGDINIALNIKAYGATKSAIEKIEKAGGSIIVEDGRHKEHFKESS